MLKKLFFSSFMFLVIWGVIYPTKKENIKLFDYCYSLEKILSRNSLQARKNILNNFESISKDIAKYGVTKTKGSLIQKIIDQYKNSKNSLIINFIPNKVFCLAGYWFEEINPGMFESIFYEKSKQKINEFKDMKDELNEFLNDINLEYKMIKKEFNGLF